MVFGFFRRQKKASAAGDPLAAYDGYLEDVERQAAEVRRSAATLLALRSTLQRDEQRFRAQAAELSGRLRLAEGKGDGKAAKVLRSDLEQAERQGGATAEALARAESNAELLVEAGKELARRADALKAERASAKARLAAGVAITAAMRAEVTRLDKVLALDKARDEVERAHALAEIYREDLKR